MATGGCDVSADVILANSGIDSSQTQFNNTQTPCIGPCRTIYNEATRKIDLLHCSSCQGWMCFKCLPYTKTEKKMLCKPEIQWRCLTCIKQAPHQPQIQTQAMDSKDMTRLSSIESKLDKALELFTTNFKRLSKEMEKKADNEVVESLRKELSDVQIELHELKTNQQKSIDKKLDSYVSELEAREERKLNFIAFSVNGSDSADGMMRKKEDTGYLYPD